jgi:hypothetical protein
MMMMMMMIPPIADHHPRPTRRRNHCSSSSSSSFRFMVPISITRFLHPSFGMVSTTNRGSVEIDVLLSQISIGD